MKNRMNVDDQQVVRVQESAAPRHWKAPGSTVRLVAYTCELDDADMFPLGIWPVDDTDREMEGQTDGFMCTGSPESSEWRADADSNLESYGYRRVEDWHYEGQGVFSACGVSTP